MRRGLGWLLIVGLLALPGLAAAQGPITAQFWYSFGGKNREVTEAYIKKFNESQAKYRIEGTFQGDYFQALAKIRAAAATKTAPAVFHVIGEAIPQLSASGLFEPLEPLPFFRSTPILYYNADLLAAKGVTPPATWDELRESAGRLTVREGNDVKVY